MSETPGARRRPPGIGPDNRGSRLGPALEDWDLVLTTVRSGSVGPERPPRHLVNLTYNTYGHVFEKAQREAATAMDRDHPRRGPLRWL
jgi:hypothetical protein